MLVNDRRRGKRAEICKLGWSLASLKWLKKEDGLDNRTSEFVAVLWRSHSGWVGLSEQALTVRRTLSWVGMGDQPSAGCRLGRGGLKILQSICGLSTPLEGDLSGSTSWLPQVIHKNKLVHVSFPSARVPIASQSSPGCIIVLNTGSRVPKRHSDGYFLNS